MYKNYIQFIIIIVVVAIVGTTNIFGLENTEKQYNTVVVLAAHGGIPSDFPKQELKQFFELHGQSHSGDKKAHDKAHKLEEKLRNWPRTKDNDPFYWGSLELKESLETVMEYPVILSFNEFCAPRIEDAILQAVEKYEAKKILVITPMLTRGGGHSEKDIPAAIERSKKQIKDNKIIIEYVWPIPVNETVGFLSEQIEKYQKKSE